MSARRGTDRTAARGVRHVMSTPTTEPDPAPEPHGDPQTRRDTDPVNDPDD